MNEKSAFATGTTVSADLDARRREAMHLAQRGQRLVSDRKRGKPATQLIVTADDFGLSGEVNEAVEIGHVSGILSAASLMVGAPAAAAAAACARRLPGLAVGLHLVLVDGTSVLDPGEIPGLVDRAGRLRTDLARLGAELVLSEQRRAELRREITAQFKAYRATGLPLDHVDVHKHFHLHPIVAREVIAIGKAFGMRVLRVPVERFATLGEVEPTRPNAGHLLIGALAARLRDRAAAASLVSPDVVFGQAWSGAMTPTRMQGLFANLPPGRVEIYTHPAISNRFPGSAPGYDYATELDALCAEGSLAALERSGACLTSYGEMLRGPGQQHIWADA